MNSSFSAFHSTAHARTGNVGMMSLIFLALFTVLFAALAYFQYENIEALKVGDPNLRIPIEKSIRKMDSKIADQHRIINEHTEYLHHLQQANQHYALQIAVHGEYYLSGHIVENGSETAVEYSGFVGLDPDGLYTHNTQASKRINHDHDIIKKWDTHYRSSKRQELPKLRNIAVTFADATNDIIGNSSNSEEGKQNEIDKLQEELESIKDRLEKLKVAQRYDESVALTKKAQLESQIRKLLELELHWLNELESDGQILETGLDFNFIIINVGAREGIIAGMRFDIFNPARGQYLRKGRCEVVKVDNTISTCRIVETLDPHKNPIAHDDHIGNPIFSATDKKSFYLAGEFTLFNKDDIARFIVKGGGIVLDKLQPGIDFLVAGNRSSKDQDQAREYNVLAMDEATVVQYLHTTFSTVQP